MNAQELCCVTEFVYMYNTCMYVCMYAYAYYIFFFSSFEASSFEASSFKSAFSKNTKMLSQKVCITNNKCTVHRTFNSHHSHICPTTRKQQSIPHCTGFSLFFLLPPLLLSGVTFISTIVTLSSLFCLVFYFMHDTTTTSTTNIAPFATFIIL